MKHQPIPGLIVTEHSTSFLDEWIDEMERRQCTPLPEPTPEPMPWVTFIHGLIWITLSIMYVIGFWPFVEAAVTEPVITKVIVTLGLIVPATVAFGIGWYLWHSQD